MEKRIIFFDIDGTLLDEKTATVPQSTLDAIHKARENGHICIVNTGRPIASIDQVIRDIGFDGYICGCGTYIEYHDEVIFHTELNEDIRKRVIQMAYECGIEAVLEGRYGIHFPQSLQHPFIKNFHQHYVDAKFPISLYSQDDIVMFDKFAAWYNKDARIDQFKEFLVQYFDVIQREDDFIEVVPLNCSKAIGIQKLCDHLHLSHDQTVSVGDSTNDLTMLSYTKESIAMGNSNPSLFDLVTYITTDINDNGIYNALKHFEII